LTISPQNLRALVEIERERRRRTALRRLPAAPADFLAQTQIETPEAPGARAPFAVWPAQAEVLQMLAAHRLIALLKARQLGISWLLCGYVLWKCSQLSGQTALLFSQGQLEANELIRRISLMHHAHAGPLPVLATDNVTELGWANGSRVISLPATRRAGRSFTASIAVLDEFAFMLWGQQVLAAVKPTIDAGGQLVVLSSADGPGTAFHRFWQEAESGANGYAPLFLPWTARPDRGPDWRAQKILEAGGDTASVLREYPANALEAFTAAADLVYGEQWSDGPEGGNVTEEADYQPGVGELYWALDDGYAGKLDAGTGLYPAMAHPRVILFVQVKPSSIDVFDELYETGTLEEDQIARALERPYASPDGAIVDSSAATLKKRLNDAEIPTRGGTHSVMQGIKHVRSWLAPDVNGRRRVRVHPRCRHLRSEFARYRMDTAKDEPVKAFDHGVDALRYLCWAQRYEG
jgi:hypothetical protein